MSRQWAVDAVWDIECSQWDQFLCGALWTAYDGQIRVYRHPGELAAALMALPPDAQTWAHAGGKYDVLWLIDYLAQQDSMPDARVSTSGSSASSVRIKQGPWLRDSARLIPMSLARAATIAGPKRAKGDPGIAFEEMHRGMPEAQWQQVIRYLISDVELLRDVLLAVGDYAQEHGIELRGTIGGTAWATAVKWCELEKYLWKRSDYEMSASMYYGGRCEVGIVEADFIHRYDRKSAYPASLMLKLPDGQPTFCDTEAAGKAFASGKPGSYAAIVNVPESLSTPLPIRSRDRLAFPWGRVTGTWNHVELQHAVKCGAKIEVISHAVTWPSEASRLAPYAAECFRLRDIVAKSNAGLALWLKFLANSLTGKLGQSPDNQIIALGDYADQFPEYKQVGISPHVWYRNTWRIPNCAMVHWAATLTARARVELHEQIRHAGDSWVYSDTDSVFALRELARNLGKNIGEWDYEGAGKRWLAKAPKVYAYYDLSKEETIAHAKGVPGAGDGAIEPELWEKFVSGEPVTSERGVKSLRLAARGERQPDGTRKEGPLFQRKKLTRAFHEDTEWCGGRLKDGRRTRAPNVTDLRRRK